MPKHGKNYKKSAEGIDANTLYPFAEAVERLLQSKYAKFDESFD